MVAVHLLAKLLEKMLDMVALGFQQTRWRAVGLAEMALILSFLMMLLNQWMGRPCLAAQRQRAPIPFIAWAPGGLGPSTGPSVH